MVEWTEKSRSTGNVAFTSCCSNEQPVAWLLENVRVAFEPSVFGGDGSELRKNICFMGVSGEIKAQLADIEKSINATTSCIKEEFLKCKINRDKVRTYDAYKNRIEIPETMRGCTVNARVHLRGKWATRQGCGLSIEVTDMQFSDQQARDEPPCPF
jgi:hypothetical protein